jgi:oxygen-independent coproporphyrinogen-3 oxidase
MLETLVRCGANRVSLGVQSFVDAEAAAVGRLHTRAMVLDDVARLRAAGITNLNVDLIAGLPHQTEASWDYSLSEVIALGVPHASVYMLEVDDDSRLGSELLAGGTRYHAHFVPDDDATADFYLRACERLGAAGIAQYEISNFARPGAESRHNLKYWSRRPYLGFGVDAHSMLPALDPGLDAVRVATPDSLDDYLAAKPGTVTAVNQQSALEESFFLGLRLNQGVDLGELGARFGGVALEPARSAMARSLDAGLLQQEDSRIRLTPRGRLLSNEVFAAFLSSSEPRPPARPDGVELSGKIH